MGSLFWVADDSIDPSDKLKQRLQWANSHRRLELSFLTKLKVFLYLSCCLSKEEDAAVRKLDKSDERVEHILDIRTLNQLYIQVQYMSKILLDPKQHRLIMIQRAARIVDDQEDPSWPYQPSESLD